MLRREAKLFRFGPSWTKEKERAQIVQEAWDDVIITNELEIGFKEHLENSKRALLKWNLLKNLNSPEEIEQKLNLLK